MSRASSKDAVGAAPATVVKTGWGSLRAIGWFTIESWLLREEDVSSHGSSARDFRKKEKRKKKNPYTVGAPE